MNDFRMSKNSAFQLSGQAVLGTATNPLLVKDDVGRGKPFTHTLPREEFAYGRINKFCESAGEGKSDQKRFGTGPSMSNSFPAPWRFHNSD